MSLNIDYNLPVTVCVSKESSFEAKGYFLSEQRKEHWIKKVARRKLEMLAVQEDEQNELVVHLKFKQSVRHKDRLTIKKLFAEHSIRAHYVKD